MTAPVCKACASCGWFGLPLRQWCPECSGIVWSDVEDCEGVVVAVTHIRRSMNRDFDPRPIILVEARPKTWLIAVAQVPVSVGARVTLTRQGRSIVGRPLLP